MGRREEAMEERICGGGGAGGKLARPPFRRRVQPTPYDRPPRTAAAVGEEGRGGWLSRLFIRPASRLFPSLFSSSFSPRPKHSPPSPGMYGFFFSPFIPLPLSSCVCVWRPLLHRDSLPFHLYQES